MFRCSNIVRTGLRLTWFCVYSMLLSLGCVSVPSETLAAIKATHALVDDYAATETYRPWYYSRIGTDRGKMGDGVYEVNIGGGSVSVQVASGWAGVWTSLMHRAGDSADTLDPVRLLGPYVRDAFQFRIVGIEVDVSDGAGLFKLELKGADDSIIYQQTVTLNGGPKLLSFRTAPNQALKKLNWLIDGPGHVTVDELRLVIEGPELSTPAAVFLFSYGHLSQCYDPATGLVRDRARWPAQEYAAVPAIGMFALASTVAADLGYLEPERAVEIVAKTVDTLKLMPRHHGLLPHFLTNGDLTLGTEWSSVDTAIALLTSILAAQSVGLDNRELEAMLAGVDWHDLTDGFTRSVSHGYSEVGTKLTARWDTFGGEAFLLATALSAAVPGRAFLMEAHETPPTWDGSGFNDEIAALLLPMTGKDRWDNDWSAYRCQAYYRQLEYFLANPLYHDLGLLGLSASEVPEPWLIANEKQVYGAWGVGGHNDTPNDGSLLVGYPIVAPHYAAMVSTEHPKAADKLFEHLAAEFIFTPLNNVESLGHAFGENVPRWNGLKGAWNLALQTLGAGRRLSEANYGPYRALAANAFLNNGFDALIPLLGEAPCGSAIDTDGDGISNNLEVTVYGTDPNLADTDGDGLGDGIEVGIEGYDADTSTRTDPTIKDSDGDGRLDGNNGRDPCEDCDNDGQVDPGESDPSLPNAFIQFSKGWNLFSYPGEVPLEHATCQDLIDAWNAVDQIVKFNPTTGRFDNCDPRGRAGFTIMKGEAYFVHAIEETNEIWPWEPACPVRVLTPGTNLVGHSAAPADLGCFDWLAAQLPEGATTLHRFNSATGRFEACAYVDPDGSEKHLVGENFPIRAGHGYLLHSTASASAVFPGCH